MIRITREADYGILLMTALAQADGQPRSAAALARQRRLPLPMVSKILKSLTRSGLLNSQRGAQGGYILALPAVEISAAAIIGALEGPIAITACSDEAHDSCARQEDCEVSGHWPRINLAIHTALQSISLKELSQPLSPRPMRFHSMNRVATARVVDRPV